MNRGKFIVLEGIDGSGKTSLCKAIVEKYNQEGKKIASTFEPTSNFIGSTIRKIITKEIDSDEKTIAALFLADRLDHIQNPDYGILKLLDQGYDVICERFYLSSYAYHVPYVTLDWVIAANKICADLLKPDVIFYIDISVETSLDRISKNRSTKDLFETKERISMVKDNYFTAMEAISKEENIIIINGERSFMKVVNHTVKEINALI